MLFTLFRNIGFTWDNLNTWIEDSKQKVETRRGDGYYFLANIGKIDRLIIT